MLNPEKKISNPNSTGGLGVNFETNVEAAFTVLLLTGQFSPCIPQWPIIEIKLQGRYAGFQTDDFIVVTEDTKNKKQAKLLGQIKHTINITESDVIFGEVIQAAWNDFINPAIFSKKTDAFALITGPLSQNDTNNVRPLLEWARHCGNEKEFLHKVSMKLFSNDIKRTKLKAFKKHLRDANDGKDVTDFDLWDFLRHYYILGYDLDTEAGTTTSSTLSLIALCSDENPLMVWEKVISNTLFFKQNAGTLSLTTIPEDLRSLFNTKNSANIVTDLEKLVDHSEQIMSNIRSEIGGVHIERNDLVAHLLDLCEKSEFVFIVGERGCGKSSLVKDLFVKLNGQHPVFCIRAEDLEHSHLDGVFTEMGLTSSLSDLEAHFALMPTKYLIIESLEKLLELEDRGAFNDLVLFIKKHPGWKIIATGRDYAHQQLVFNYFEPSKIDYSPLTLNGFDENQMNELYKKVEPLKRTIQNQSLKELIKNPFFANLAYRIALKGVEISNIHSENGFKTTIWNEVISNESFRAMGMSIRRKKTFIEISVLRAKRMVYDLPETDFDSGALLKLEEDGVIHRELSSGRICPAHDIFEDLGLEQYIENAFISSSGKPREFFDTIGQEPAINRAFRLWLNNKLEDDEQIARFILTILRDKTIDSRWHDEAVTAVLLGTKTSKFLNELEDQLFEDNCALLKKFCFILRLSCKISDQEIIKKISRNVNQPVSRYGLFLIPDGKGWNDIISFLFEHRKRLGIDLLPHISAVLDEWSIIIQLEKEQPQKARDAGLLALYFLDEIKNAHRNENDRKRLLSVIIKTIPTTKKEFNALLDDSLSESKDGGKHQRFLEELMNSSLMETETAFLCKYDPGSVIRLGLFAWVIDKRGKASENLYPSYADIDSYFGLHEYHGSNLSFFPPSGAKGPFQYLFHYHPRVGLDFLINLLNVAADRYAHSDIDKPERHEFVQKEKIGPEQIEIMLNDGTKIKQYSSERLWLAYRGHSVVPDVLQSALMAFENWLYDMVEKYKLVEETKSVFEYTLRKSNSVMPTAVLAAIATEFPTELGTSSFPLLRTPELYDLDLVRYCRDKCDGKRIVRGLGNNPREEYYYEERRVASLRSCRDKDLEVLALQLQLTAFREQIFSIVDDLRSRFSDEEKWKIRFHRIDLRVTEPEYDDKKGVIVFNPCKIEPEVAAVQDKMEKEQSLTDRFLKLNLWAEKTLKKQKPDREYYRDWKEIMVEIKELSELLITLKPDDISDAMMGMASLFIVGIVKASVVLIRDNSTEMKKEDLQICAEIITEAVLMGADSGNSQFNSSPIDNGGAAASASILPKLLDFASNISEKEHIKKLIATALTHPTDIVRERAADGVRVYMWERDPAFAQLCFTGAIEFAWLRYDVHRSNLGPHGYQTIDDRSNEKTEAMTKVDHFREKLVSGEIESKHIDDRLNSYTLFYILTPCLIIPDNSSAIDHTKFLLHIIQTIIDSEVESNDHSKNDNDRLQINPDTLIKCSIRISEFLVHLNDATDQRRFSQLLNLGCKEAPCFIRTLLAHIRISAINTANDNRYWSYWNDISSTVQKLAVTLANDKPRCGRRDDVRRLLRDMLFCNTVWNHNAEEIAFISAGKEQITRFVLESGVNSDVYEAMARFMYYFPELFFDSGLFLLSKHQERLSTIDHITKNAAHYLENSIGQMMVARNVSRLPADIFEAIRILLEALINTGSSRAYYLREQLIQSRRVKSTL